MVTLFKPIPKRQRRILASAGLLVVLATWCALTYGSLVPPYFLSSPSAVLTSGSSLFSEKGFTTDILYSVGRITVGFLISALLGIPLGLAVGIYSVADALVAPILSFLRYLPVPALIPFCILWFGIGETEKVIIVSIGILFQLVFMIADVVKNTPEEFVDLAITFGAKDWGVLRTVVLPNAAAQIYDLLRITFGWAWGWLLVAELVGANRGIGFTILRSQRYLLNADMIVGLLVVGLLGLVTDYLFRFVRPRLFKWEA
jgi:NitT/TauT family transport system permease protein